MLNKMRNKQGFTLIELLIVVAIIGILAAIAIPQFSKYRMQGFNASGNSDMRNIRTSQESLFAEWQHYGKSEAIANVAALPGSGGYGTGVAVAPTNALPLIIITTTDNATAKRGLQIPVGNNITVEASTPAAGAGDGGSFTVAAKHLMGDVIFAADSDSTTNYKLTYNAALTQGTPSGTALPVGSALIPVVTDVDQYQAAAAAGWVKM